MHITNAALGEFRIVVPFAKFEKTEDGRLMVEGIATSEALDGDNEVMDYESAKAAFANWSGNIREQHDPKKAVGRAVEVIADDATKTIRLKAFVSKGAPDTQAKVMDGTLAAYSIAGSVKARKPEKVTKGDTTIEAQRVFVKRLTETSLVDAGCNPESAVAIVKSEGEKVVGVDVLAEIAEPAVVKGTDEQVADFAKALNEAGLTLADAIGMIKGRGTAAALKSAVDAYVAADTARAADLQKRVEGKTGVELMKVAAEVLTTDEIMADGIVKADKRDEAMKAAILAKAPGRSAEDMLHLQGAHDAMKAMGAMCTMKAAKPEEKAPDESVVALTKTVATLEDQVKKLLAQPVPYVTLRTTPVAKGAEPAAAAAQIASEAPLESIELEKGDYIYHGDGTIDYATSRLMKRQKLASAAAGNQ